MIVVIVLIGTYVLLGVVAAFEQHRRRSVLESTIWTDAAPTDAARAARRKILRAERARARLSAGTVMLLAFVPRRRTEFRGSPWT